MLCELLEADGAVVLWSDCGSAELELLDGVAEELLGHGQVFELPEDAGAVLWSDCGSVELELPGVTVWPLLLVLVLGAAVLELEDDDEGVWLLEDGSWFDCG